jgi:hypothetical protein
MWTVIALMMSLLSSSGFSSEKYMTISPKDNLFDLGIFVLKKGKPFKMTACESGIAAQSVDGWCVMEFTQVGTPSCLLDVRGAGSGYVIKGNPQVTIIGTFDGMDAGAEWFRDCMSAHKVYVENAWNKG